MARLSYFPPLLLFLLLFPSPVSAAGPSLKILSPLEGEVIKGYVVRVEMEIKNFALKDYRNLSEVVSGQGFINLWLDEEKREGTNARKWFRGSEYSFADVPVGEHELVVELVGNDGSSLNPRVFQAAKFRTEVSGESTDKTPGSSVSNVTPVSRESGISEVSGREEKALSGIRGPLIFSLASFFLGVVSFWLLKR